MTTKLKTKMSTGVKIAIVVGILIAGIGIAYAATDQRCKNSPDSWGCTDFFRQWKNWR